MELASQNKKWRPALFVMLIVILLAFPAGASRMLDENVKVKRVPNFEGLNFGMLPRGVIVPPSGPSRGLSPGTPPSPPHRPRPENVRSERINFGMLPRGVIVPPSGPSSGLSPGTPPLPPHNTENVNFGMIPKILNKAPPSGPNRRTSDPPPPPSRSERIN
ncbi:hypothetical protein CMV_004393 [Castanea mollissima]|uniref:Uncharacterized protein n=1 Tax=Castanea mollissima TaxID=60419 RepID=A0A8J4RFL2_9ROSI|nr:hypothetical protein CMV_004393 [Castanea mollissima]